MSAQVRPRTKVAGAKWIIEVEVMSRQSPARKEKAFKERDSERVTVLSTVPLI